MRKHLSRSRAAGSRAPRYPARVVTLAISDVPGDDPAVIGSGPTVPDPSTLADARAIVARYQARPARQRSRARSTIPRTKARSRATRRSPTREFTSDRAPGRCLPRRRSGGRRPPATNASSSASGLEGEAREVAAEHAALARELQAAGPPRRDPLRRRTDRDDPRQGPRRAEPGIRAGARHRARRSAGHRRARRRHRRHRRRGGSADDPAGAYRGRRRPAPRARELGLDPAAFLADNDSTGFFERLGDLLRPGPTFTNVNDFRAILVDSPMEPARNR